MRFLAGLLLKLGGPNAAAPYFYLMRFSDIPPLLSAGSWECGYSLERVPGVLEEWKAESGLQLVPDFQRGRVWNPAQQSAFMEYLLRGGRSGMVIFFNAPSWHTTATTAYNEFVCVDGLQRLTAIERFLAGEIPAFGQRHGEFGDSIRCAPGGLSLRFNVNSLQTREQVLTWYLQINDGGTPHTEAEVSRVKALLASAQNGRAEKK